MIKYSFILATKNAEKTIRRSIASIATQTYPHYEIIIQDCESEDATINILQEYKNINIISEYDSGVYDAWNKAIKRVTGDWVIFFGSDDMLLNENVLASCHTYIKKLREYILFAYCNMVFGINMKIDAVENHSLSKLYHTFLTNMGMQFSATFIRSSILKTEKFDTSYKIAADFDFAARLINGENVAHIPVMCTYMERGGLSTNEKDKCLLLDERCKVLYTHIVPRAGDILQYSTENIWNNES